jgi:hypothetical protein
MSFVSSLKRTFEPSELMSAFGGKAVDMAECPLMTQSGHRLPLNSDFMHRVDVNRYDTCPSLRGRQ